MTCLAWKKFSSIFKRTLLVLTPIWSDFLQGIHVGNVRVTDTVLNLTAVCAVQNYIVKSAVITVVIFHPLSQRDDF